MKQKFWMLLLAGMGLSLARLDAITAGPFGAHGEGGSKNGQTLTIGAGGSVFEINGYFAIEGQDLNGAQLGNTADLASDPLPAGLVFAFTSEISTNGANLLLSYSFSNATTAPFPNTRFFSLFDAEIDEKTNTFFNEYGAAKGVIGVGAPDPKPDQWQIDEPGFQNGTLLRNLFLGLLDNTNSVPQGRPNDVAMGLGFSLGNMAPGATNVIQILISDYTNSIGNFALVQKDAAFASATTLTMSGGVNQNINVNSLPSNTVTNNPGTNGLINATGQLGLAFQWSLNRPTGSLRGALTISNPAESGVAFSGLFRLGLNSSRSLYFVRQEGVLNDGLPYADLSEAMTPLLTDGILAPGQSVTLPAATVDVYSGDRGAPNLSSFEIWANRRP